MKDERNKLKQKMNKIQLKLTEHFRNVSKKEIKHIRALYSSELQKAVKNVEEFYKSKIQNLCDEIIRLQNENKELKENYKSYKELKMEHERISSVIDTKYLRQELNRFLSLIDHTKDKIELLEYKDSRLKINHS